MKLELKRFSISLLFCLIFIVIFNSVDVYAKTYEGYITSSDIGDKYGSLYSTLNPTDGSTSGLVLDIEGIGSAIKKYHCEKFLESAENDFAELNFVAKVKVEGDTRSYDHTNNPDGTTKSCVYDSDSVDKEFPVTEMDTSFLSESSNSIFTITIELGDNTYILKTHTKKDALCCSDSGKHKISNKNSLKYGGSAEKGDAWYQMAVNAEKILEYFQECAIEGIIAGSVGAGYNVATPYSDGQLPLSEITEWTGYGRDFKKVGGVKYALSYYYSPIFGPLYVNKDPKIPTTTEEWIELGKNQSSTFIKGYDIILYSGFRDYALSLSDTQVNERGEKIVDKLTIDYGAKRMNIAGSKDPKSVLSYNMQIAVPYVFQVENMKAQLGTNYLRVMDKYTFNIYNDKIYNTDNNTQISDDLEVTTMYQVMGGYLDEYLYLFSQSVDVDDGNGGTTTVKYGVILVGLFDETVVDTTEDFNSSFSTANLMLTGRKIGLDNSYSDNLPIEGQNASLMFVRGRNTNLKSAYKPINSFFPVETGDLEIMNIRDTFTGLLHQTHPDLVDEVEEKLKPMEDTDFYNYINDKNMHSQLPKHPKVVRFLIDFDQIYIDSPVEGGDPTATGDYAFFFIRNNAYVNDESLIEWLKTDTAESLKYVYADELLAKILGDFTDKVTELTYQEWLAVQEIKGELQYYKDRWIIDVLNIVSMVLGVALMIFASLFILAYWIDIFNTFTDFSILQYISFGNLYSVSSDDMGFYMNQHQGNCKYVTFKDVLIIACIMIAMGLVFMNVQSIISFIIYIYSYLMGVLNL